MSPRMGILRPRVVLVTRKTPLEVLLERRGTHAQARFYLESRGQQIAGYEEGHARFERAMAEVQRALPPDQRRVRVDRDDLDRFLFGPDDLLVVVGQDGLVPNLAKYLQGQLVIGINPDPERFDGVLCPHPASRLPELLKYAEDGAGKGFAVQERTMAEAVREDGQRLLALNELYVGHQTHQSSRYVISALGRSERHSSSGVIVATGTGSTGWARSVATQRKIEEPLPGPEERRLAFFVREPFPSVFTQTDLDFGLLGHDDRMTLDSLLGDDGVVFADGIETDRLEFLDGQRVTIGVAPERLRLVVSAG